VISALSTQNDFLVLMVKYTCKKKREKKKKNKKNKKKKEGYAK
jgi:hypothetical protein